MQIRGQKRQAGRMRNDSYALKKRALEKEPQQIISAEAPIESLSPELLYLVCHYLDVRSLKNLCYVSTGFQMFVQPLIFRSFESGLYDQKGLWKRLSGLAEALKNRPFLGQEITHISIRLSEFEHVETLAQLLRPILSRTTKLRSLSIPIHASTAKLLQDRAFGYLGQDLDVRKTYNTVFSLNELNLARHPIHCDQLGTQRRQGELQLQHIEIGSCQLKYQSTIKLLRRLRSLKIFRLNDVELWDSKPSSRCSKAVRIVAALNSSRHNLTNLTLNIGGNCDAESEGLGIASFESFTSLQYLEVHEYDLASDVILPATLIRLGLLDFQSEPSFPFSKNLACASLPPKLEIISSYSREPNLLRQRIKEYSLLVKSNLIFTSTTTVCRRAIFDGPIALPIKISFAQIVESFLGNGCSRSEDSRLLRFLRVDLRILSNEAIFTDYDNPLLGSLQLEVFGT